MNVRRAHPSRDEPLTCYQPARGLDPRLTSAAPLRRLRLPAGAGAGTNPDTRHCHASIVLVPSYAREVAHHHLAGGGEFGEQLAHRRQGHAHLGGDLEVEPLTVLLQALRTSCTVRLPWW